MSTVAVGLRSPEREIFSIGDELDFDTYDDDRDFEPKKVSRVAKLCSYISLKLKKIKYAQYDDDL